MPVTAYKPKSNVIGSHSVPQHLEKDYLEMKRMLQQSHMGLGEYLVLSFRELHKGYEDDFSARTMRYLR